MNHPGYSEIYSCSQCNKNIGRDINAAKNILMKGIIEHLEKKGVITNNKCY